MKRRWIISIAVLTAGLGHGIARAQQPPRESAREAETRTAQAWFEALAKVEKECVFVSTDWYWRKTTPSVTTVTLAFSRSCSANGRSL